MVAVGGGTTEEQREYKGAGRTQQRGGSRTGDRSIMAASPLIFFQLALG